MLVQKLFIILLWFLYTDSRAEYFDMHILIFPVLAFYYSLTAIYPDAERVIWMRSRHPNWVIHNGADCM